MKKKKIEFSYREKIKYKRKQILISIILAIVSIYLIFVFARYVTNGINDFFIRSKEFYFNSDKLTENLASYQIDNWSGVDDYIITINMNSMENNKTVGTYDISYDIKYTATSNVNCQLSKTEGIIYANTNTDFFNLRVIPNRALETGDKVIIEIEATSTAQYTKTLKGRFTLVVGKENLSYEITDSVQMPYMELSLTNTLTYYIIDEAFDSYTKGQKIDIDTYLALPEDKRNKCYSSIATIKFNPNEILFDVTNAVYQKAESIGTTVINEKTYINEITIKIDAISSVDLRFYKVDVSKDYTYPNSSNSSVVTVTNI